MNKIISLISVIIVPIILYFIMNYVIGWEQRKTLIVSVATGVVLLLFAVRDFVQHRIDQ